MFNNSVKYSAIHIQTIFSAWNIRIFYKILANKVNLFISSPGSFSKVVPSAWFICTFLQIGVLLGEGLVGNCSSKKLYILNTFNLQVLSHHENSLVSCYLYSLEGRIVKRLELWTGVTLDAIRFLCKIKNIGYKGDSWISYSLTLR